MSDDDLDEIVMVEEVPRDRPPRSWDFFLTVFLIFVLLVLTVIFVLYGFSYGVQTLACSDSDLQCNYDFISFGSLIVILGVPFVALTGIIVSIVWIARRKVSFPVALVAALLVVGVFILGSYIVDLAVPGR